MMHACVHGVTVTCAFAPDEASGGDKRSSCSGEVRHARTRSYTMTPIGMRRSVAGMRRSIGIPRKKLTCPERKGRYESRELHTTITASHQRLGRAKA